MCPGPTSRVASPPAQESVSSKLHLPRLMKCISKRSGHMEHTSHNSLPSCINVGLRYRFPFRDQMNSFRSLIPEGFFLVGFFFFFFLKISRHKSSSRDEANVLPPICINECMNMIIKSWTFSRTGCRVPRVCEPQL